MPTPIHHCSRYAFTLIEILVVVVILGILAAIVIPQFTGSAEDTQRAVFASNIKEFAKAVERYHMDTGTWPEDSPSGDVPAGLDDYIITTAWEGGTPIGGVWDTELNSMGITSAVGVHFNDGSDPGAAAMALIDEVIDDGDVTTGTFRMLQATRYYWIVAE